MNSFLWSPGTWTGVAFVVSHDSMFCSSHVAVESAWKSTVWSRHSFNMGLKLLDKFMVCLSYTCRG